MSVLIKGMEMPKNCEVCPLNFYECALLEKSSEEIMQYFGGDSRHPDCPLVEVPKHGRLIDADALEEILLKVIDINASIEQRNEATEQERRCLWWFEQQIGIAPTIIPAEEGE